LTVLKSYCFQKSATSAGQALEPTFSELRPQFEEVTGNILQGNN